MREIHFNQIPMPKIFFQLGRILGVLLIVVVLLASGVISLGLLVVTPALFMIPGSFAQMLALTIYFGLILYPIATLIGSIYLIYRLFTIKKTPHSTLPTENGTLPGSPNS